MDLLKTRRSSIYSYKCCKFIVYELDTWVRNLNTKFALGDCLFGTVNLTKNTDPDKYRYSGCGNGFVVRFNK